MPSSPNPEDTGMRRATTGPKRRETDPYTLALRAVGRKERTVAELDQWLEAREVSESDRADVIERLITAEALDDAGYARRFTEDKRHLSGWGAGRIREALRSRGVAIAHIDAALSDEDHDSEAGRAVEALQSRGFDLSDDRGKGKAFGFLARRGYTREVAYAAIRKSSPG